MTTAAHAPHAALPVGAERPFLVRVSTTDAAGRPVEVDRLARAVIDASGTWGRSDPLGGAGLPARGERAAAASLAGPLPDVLGRDRSRFAGRRAVVVAVTGFRPDPDVLGELRLDLGPGVEAPDSAGDRAAAAEVALDLPATGVRSASAPEVGEPATVGSPPRAWPTAARPTTPDPTPDRGAPL